MNLFIVVGCVSVGILVFAICLAGYKNIRIENASYTLIPVSGCSPKETSVQLVRALRKGIFLMHTLSNEASPFDDDAWLSKYKSYIQNPSVVAYIQNITGGYEYE